jgi:carbonic anhydrase
MIMGMMMSITVAGTIPAWADHGEWSYSGSGAPEHWGTLQHEFAECQLGMHQSPIDIQNTKASNSVNIQFDYVATPLTVANNGHSIQVNYASGSTVTIDGEKYALLQFHFHTPSEHRIGGISSPMELHLVHRHLDAAKSNQLAVLAVMLKEGDANPVIQQIWDNIPPMGQNRQILGQSLNAIALLPQEADYYSYDGSLTTPPCTENVKWYIFEQPMAVSVEQIQAFQSIYAQDARPLQPINGRTVEGHHAMSS